MENTLPVGGTHECNHACMWSIIGDEGFRGTRPGPPPYPHTLEGRACTLTLLCVCVCVCARARVPYPHLVRRSEGRVRTLSWTTHIVAHACTTYCALYVRGRCVPP
jgi:hypothetical protein